MGIWVLGFGTRWEAIGIWDLEFWVVELGSRRLDNLSIRRKVAWSVTCERDMGQWLAEVRCGGMGDEVSKR